MWHLVRVEKTASSDPQSEDRRRSAKVQEERLCRLLVPTVNLIRSTWFWTNVKLSNSGSKAIKTVFKKLSEPTSTFRDPAVGNRVRKLEKGGDTHRHRTAARLQ